MNPFGLISTAHAQGFTDTLAPLIQGPMPMFVMIGLVFYMLVFRPQQQKQKEMRTTLGALKRGDKVVTGGGILGIVQKVGMMADKAGKQVPNNEIEVEIAANVRITVLRDTITTVIKPVAANDSKPTK